MSIPDAISNVKNSNMQILTFSVYMESSSVTGSDVKIYTDQIGLGIPILTFFTESNYFLEFPELIEKYSGALDTTYPSNFYFVRQLISLDYSPIIMIPKIFSGKILLTSHKQIVNGDGNVVWVVANSDDLDNNESYSTWTMVKVVAEKQDVSILQEI